MIGRTAGCVAEEVFGARRGSVQVHGVSGYHAEDRVLQQILIIDQ